MHMHTHAHTLTLSYVTPTHLSRAFLHLSAILSTFSLSLMISFLTWSLSVWPHAHLHIFISVTSSFFAWELVTGTVSIPYSIAGWTIILFIFPFTCGGTLLSHRTPDIFLQSFHPHCVLLFISVLILSSLCRVLPRIRWPVAAGQIAYEHFLMAFHLDTCNANVTLILATY